MSSGKDQWGLAEKPGYKVLTLFVFQVQDRLPQTLSSGMTQDEFWEEPWGFGSLASEQSIFFSPFPSLW